MTSAPLMAHGIRDRGLVREGFYADLVLLDQEKLCVNQDITGEKRSPLGIEKVFVNGVLTVDNGVHLGARAGMFCQRR